MKKYILLFAIILAMLPINSYAVNPVPFSNGLSNFLEVQFDFTPTIQDAYRTYYLEFNTPTVKSINGSYISVELTNGQKIIIWEKLSDGTYQYVNQHTAPTGGAYFWQMSAWKQIVSGNVPVTDRDTGTVLFAGVEDIVFNMPDDRTYLSYQNNTGKDVYLELSPNGTSKYQLMSRDWQGQYFTEQYTQTGDQSFVIKAGDKIVMQYISGSIDVRIDKAFVDGLDEIPITDPFEYITINSPPNGTTTIASSIQAEAKYQVLSSRALTFSITSNAINNGWTIISHTKTTQGDYIVGTYKFKKTLDIGNNDIIVYLKDSASTILDSYQLRVIRKTITDTDTDGKDDTTGEDITDDVLDGDYEPGTPIGGGGTLPDRENYIDGIVGELQYQADKIGYYIMQPLKWISQTFQRIEFQITEMQESTSGLLGLYGVMFSWLPEPIVAGMTTVIMSCLLVLLIVFIRKVS